jgi:hypothetical protein
MASACGTAWFVSSDAMIGYARMQASNGAGLRGSMRHFHRLVFAQAAAN